MDLVQPVSTVWSLGAIQDMLSAEITVLGSTAQIILYQNNVNVDFNTVLSDLQEANFSGYARTTVSAWAGPGVDTDYSTYYLSTLAVFACSGAGVQNQIYGAALIAPVAGGSTATATAVTNGSGGYGVVTVTAGGSGYITPPAITFTGATGSGAAGYAVLTAGVVTSVVITNPGSAYTTFTLTLDGPNELIVTNPFSDPISMAGATDLLPFLQELALPPVVTY